MMIDFLGLGAQKAGTSTLYDILKQHSQLYLPEQKEAHFFDLSENYKKGFKWLEQFFFYKCPAGKVKGEFTPEYLYIVEAPKRIEETLGKDVKFIVVLRHPVDRAVSHYNMIIRRGLEKSDFYAAIAKEDERICVSEIYKQHFSYMSRGYYSVQIERYLELFASNNFLFLAFEEDIVKNLKQTISRIQQFLGVRYEELNCDIVSNDAYVPKSLKLNQFLRTNKIIKRVGNLMVPKTLKIAIMHRFYKWNKSDKKSGLYKLVKSEKDRLFKDYFYNDAVKLEALTGINFLKIWYHE